MANDLDKIRAKAIELTPLYNRMDADKKLIDNVPFIFRDFYGKIVSDVYNVTIPNGALFYAKMVALISGVNRTPEVIGDLKDDEKADITDIIKDIDIEIDRNLNNKQEDSAFMTHASQFCGEGWSAEQIMMREENGVFIADSRPLQVRWLQWATGIKGIKWFSYLMERSREDIEEKYNFTIQGTTAKVRVYFDDKLQKVWVNEKQKDEQENPYGYPPIVIQAAPFGPGMLRGQGAIAKKGESIFYPHRDMFEEMNFMASLLKTKSYDEFRPGLQIPGSKSKKGPKKYPTTKSIVGPDKLIQLIPTRDMTNAQRNFMGMISAMMQRAGLSELMEGSITMPLAAVAITKMLAQKESLTFPRLVALEMVYRARQRMINRQLIELGGTIEIGEEGMKRKYNVSDLSDAYILRWTYSNTTLEDEAAKAAIANSQTGKISDNTIRRKTLKLDNPEEEENLLEIQDAKRREPLLQDLERLHSLIDEDTKQANDAAWVLFHKVETIFKQRNLNGVAEPEALTPKDSKQVLPVFGGGGGGGGRVPAEVGGGQNVET